MAINKNFYTPTAAIQWNGETACEVRGISPDDITRLVAEDGELVARLVELVEGDVRKQGVTQDGAAQYLEQNAQRLFGFVLKQIPMLVAKLIALAADDDGAADQVRKWPVPLQFEIMRQIAILTFVDADGFRKFLGNVMGLAGSLGGQRPAAIPQETPETAGTTG